MQNALHTVGPRATLQMSFSHRWPRHLYHYSAWIILNLWVYLLDISILPYICPYWTSSCFWFIEVTLTSIPVFWGVRIYAFLNLYSVDLISKGWKNRRKPRLTRVIRLAVSGKIKCRFGPIIQNPIWQKCFGACNYLSLKKQNVFLSIFPSTLLTNRDQTKG